MTNAFINLTNHPSDNWEEKQRNAALEYGTIIDIPFPAINAQDDTKTLALLADEYLKKVMEIAPPVNATVHLMGEQSFCHSLLFRLQSAGYLCVASTTVRCVKETCNNERSVTFHFERFREYEDCRLKG